LKKIFVIAVILSFLHINVHAESVFEDKIVPSIMIVEGVGLAAMWTIDILTTDVMNEGFFRSKNNDDALLWTHWTAEYLTAAGLIAGGFGLLAEKEWARTASLVSLGAMLYTSINSSGWALGNKERYPYAVPMYISLAASGVCIGVLF
jgi:hypothetical protein